MSKMHSIISEIQKLRDNIPILPDRNNKNRYCIISNDGDLKTAYCFSVPIYDSAGILLDLRFKEKLNTTFYQGSNAHIEINDIITFNNQNGSFNLDLLDGGIIGKSDNIIQYRTTDISPTINGLIIKRASTKNEHLKIKFTALSDTSSCWANDRCFCLMKNDFEPIISISGIGASIDSDNISNPIKMSYTQTNDYEYILEFSNNNPMSKYIHLEVNMYEKKLFQDTTVESSHPLLNNVYGTTSYIGLTSLLGEQWLYSRIDHTLISEFYNRKVEKVIMHIPTHNIGHALFESHGVSRRFCSFGSTWSDKIPEDIHINDPVLNNGYYSIDISTQIIDLYTGHMKITEGIILKPKSRNSGFTVLSTGDCASSPQILEICYR